MSPLSNSALAAAPEVYDFPEPALQFQNQKRHHQFQKRKRHRQFQNQKRHRQFQNQKRHRQFQKRKPLYRSLF
jgi:hypothetical protein